MNAIITVARIALIAARERPGGCLVPRGCVRLHKHGNTVSVTIPRPLLYTLGWICGRDVIVELTEDCRAVVVRLPEQRDFGLAVPPRLAIDPPAVKA